LPENPHNERLKRTYFEFCHEAQGRDDKSIRKDEVAILRFEGHIGFRDFGTLSKDEAIAFKSTLRNSGLTMPVIKATLAVVSKFHSWMCSQPGYRRKIAVGTLNYLNLTAKERRKCSRPEKPVPYPTPVQVDQLLKQMPHKTSIEKRDRAAICLLAMTGIRARALVTLRMKHLDLTRRFVHQPSTEVDTKFSKNQCTCLVVLFPEWYEVLLDYVDHLKGKGFDSDDPLFPKTEIERNADFGRRSISNSFVADSQMIQRLVPKYFLDAGLPRFTSHCFRHMLNKLPFDRNQGIAVAKAMRINLGHSIEDYGYGQFTFEERSALLQRLVETNEVKGDTELLAQLAKRLSIG